MKRVFARVTLASMLAAAVASGPELRAQTSQELGLRGSWEIRITQPNLSPLPFGLDFRILRTVTAEGVVDAYAFPGFGAAGPQPGLFSNSGHGIWTSVQAPVSCVPPDPFASLGGGTCSNGGWLPPGMTPPPSSNTAVASRQYRAVVKYFQIDQTGFPNVLHSVGTVTEQITIAADGNSYTSQFVTQVHAPNGTLIFTNQGGSTATRIR